MMGVIAGMTSATAAKSRRLLTLLVALGAVSVAWPVLVASGWGSARPLCAIWTQRDTQAASTALVLPTNYGGVHHYTIPGQFKPEEFTRNTSGAGVLHVYLKALRWPVGKGIYHLRLKGFVAFEATAYSPQFIRDTFSNPHELPSNLHLYVRSATSGWKREVSIAFSDSHCEQRAAIPDYNFTKCIEAPERKNSTYYTLGDVSIDFGNTKEYRYELLVNNWPRRISLQAQLLEALSSPSATNKVDEPVIIRALPTPMFWYKAIDASILARILAWGDEYYAPLGLNATYLYVLPLQVAELEAQAIIQGLLATKRLNLVLWDDLAYHNGWRYFDEQFVQTHSILSHWGSNVRVMVFDVDEFLVPGTIGDTLPKMLAPGGCLSASTSRDCIAFRRVNIHPYNLSDAAGLAEAPDEPSLWNQSGPNPLLNYRFSNPIPVAPNTPKMMAYPKNMMPVNVHWASACSGKPTVLTEGEGKLQSVCDTRVPCAWPTKDCAYIVHVAHMFEVRKPPERTFPIEPLNWLWMLQNSSAQSA